MHNSRSLSGRSAQPPGVRSLMEQQILQNSVLAKPQTTTVCSGEADLCEQKLVVTQILRVRSKSSKADLDKNI